jgi:uncharacterized protein (TIGR03437 family)
MRAYTIQKVIKSLRFALFLCVAAAGPLAAQTPVFDTSGNGMLNGTYYFRHVYYLIDTGEDSNGVIGDINNAIAVYGNITFSGNGTYSFTNAQGTPSAFVSDFSGGFQSDPLSCYLANAACTASQATAVNGTYSISASGFGFLVDPVTGDNILGLVAANGIFSGSSTEDSVSGEFTDLFIGAPLVAPVATAFKGAYTVVGFSPGQDFSFALNPSGSGTLSLAINGYYEGGGNSTLSQSVNVPYMFSNGAGVLNFPNNSSANFFTGGQEFVYFSPDGNFFFGGSPTGFDMILGVNNASSDQSFGTCNGGSSCLYYQAGIDQDFSDLGNGYADLDGYYGSFNATSNGNIIAHERLADQEFYVSAYGYTFADSFTPPVTGAYVDNGYSVNYWVGDGGTVRIGEGIGPYLGLTVAFQAPTFTPSGSVYINPTGIVNAASFSPFTSGVAPGEFITIFGNNLAPSTCGPCVVSTAQFDVNNAFPTMLNGVQVMIDGVAAPIYYVAPGQIAAIVPSGNPYSIANVQVINNGDSSNVVSELINPTVPGIYTTASDGIGYGSIVDTNTGQIVTPSTPANPGDTVEVFATGLGTVYPTVADGAAPPDSPLSYTVGTITADVDGNDATVVFAGLAPTLAGLYQVNVTIPSTTAAGDHALDISGYNQAGTLIQSYEQQVLISVGGGLARPAKPSLRKHARPANAPDVQRSRRCFGGKTNCAAQPQRILPLPNARAAETVSEP